MFRQCIIALCCRLLCNDGPLRVQHILLLKSFWNCLATFKWVSTCVQFHATIVHTCSIIMLMDLRIFLFIVSVAWFYPINLAGAVKDESSRTEFTQFFFIAGVLKLWCIPLATSKACSLATNQKANNTQSNAIWGTKVSTSQAPCMESRCSNPLQGQNDSDTVYYIYL